MSYTYLSMMLVKRKMVNKNKQLGLKLPGPSAARPYDPAGLTHMPIGLKQVKEALFERVLLDQVFVQGDAQAGSLGEVEVAILGAGGSGHGLDHPGFGEIVEALLHLDVGGAEIEMHARRRADRAVGVVRRHHHAARIGHGRNLLHIQNSPRVDDVGLQDIRGAGFQDLAETVVGKVTLARGHRNLGLGQRPSGARGYPPAGRAPQSSPGDRVRAGGQFQWPWRR